MYAENNWYSISRASFAKVSHMILSFMFWFVVENDASENSEK